VIIRFRSLLEAYTLIMPFHQLSDVKAGNESCSIFLEENKLIAESEKLFLKLVDFRKSDYFLISQNSH
jgi:hypothetical protein